MGKLGNTADPEKGNVSAPGEKRDISDETGIRPEDYKAGFSVNLPVTWAAAFRAWCRNRGYGPSEGIKGILLEFMRQNGIRPAPEKQDDGES